MDRAVCGGSTLTNCSGWHLHPQHDPASHVAIDQMSVFEIVMLLKQVVAAFPSDSVNTFSGERHPAQRDTRGLTRGGQTHQCRMGQRAGGGAEPQSQQRAHLLDRWHARVSTLEGIEHSIRGSRRR